MKIDTPLPDVLILTPDRFGDDCGRFSETFNAPRLRAMRIVMDWVRDNHSMSAKAGTLRGLHYQRPRNAQDKLVRRPHSAILDVAVDFRAGSVTHGKWVGGDLTPENRCHPLVPKGFLHGFITLQPGTEVQYKCSDVYAPDCDDAVRCDDPDLAIVWGITDPVLSAKDAAAPWFRDVVSSFGAA